MIPHYLQHYFWIPALAWFILYTSDYYLTLWGAKLYMSQSVYQYEGSYEMTPEYVKDVDNLRKISPTHIIWLIAGTVGILGVGYLGKDIPHFFGGFIGFMIIPELAIHARHISNIFLFRTLSSSGKASVKGHAVISRVFSYHQSAISLFTFAVIMFIFFAMTNSDVFIGGGFGLLMVVYSDMKLSRQLSSKQEAKRGRQMAHPETLTKPAGLDDSAERMPVLFVGHGSPMNAIEDNEFSRSWTEIGRSVPKPKAVLCISAHWVTDGTKVTAMKQPRTIHDFYGFPDELYEVRYPAPGSPELAEMVRQMVRNAHVEPDSTWGIDHGTWLVLSRMFPDADIPVVQLSLDGTKEPVFHYELAKELRQLRDEGVLILGSGNIVHNLGLVNWDDAAYGWALEFDEKVKQFILSGGHESIIHYEQFGDLARLSIPTNEHYLPLLYALAQQDSDDRITFSTERVTLGSISMRSVMIGFQDIK